MRVLIKVLKLVCFALAALTFAGGVISLIVGQAPIPFLTAFVFFIFGYWLDRYERKHKTHDERGEEGAEP